MNYPEEFFLAPLELEIDFGEKGGVQRFKTVGDFQAWLREEQEFWSWLDRPPANQHHNQVGNMVPQFQKIFTNCRRQIDENNQRWNQTRSIIKQLQERSLLEGVPDSEKESNKSKIEQHSSELKGILDQFRAQVEAFLKHDILSGRIHLSRMEPGAEFIRELAESNPEEAVYALDQILLTEQRNGDPRRVEHSGRMMATLYTKNLNRKSQSEKKAFEKAIVTWSKELADFKSRYEAQEEEFRQISARNAQADTAWKERSDALAEEFEMMRAEKEKDLKALTDTYETHMQLKGPLLYWKTKRKEHAKGKLLMGIASAISGVAGACLLIWATYLILPESAAKDQIPWRSIALFVLISTFVLWLVRLFVKLMLSHIHLYADAREREVMISTFMALVRRQESREGIAKLDLALVLAPIFKPSTTGVIQDDGGPTTLTDFIGRMTGK